MFRRRVLFVSEGVFKRVVILLLKLLDWFGFKWVGYVLWFSFVVYDGENYILCLGFNFFSWVNIEGRRKIGGDSLI